MNGRFLVGWANADITPEKPVLLAGQFHSRISEGVQNPITVTILAMESERNGTHEKLIWVSCDLAHVPDGLRDMVREGVTKRIPEFEPANIILNATHTHTAPDVAVEQPVASKRKSDGLTPFGGGNTSTPFGLKLPVMTPCEYLDFAVPHIVNAIHTAWSRREPSGIGFGLGHAVVGYNRNVRYANSDCFMYGNPNDPNFTHIEGHEDHGVNVLAVWNRFGQLTGMVVNVACPSQMTEHLFELSADYWHETRMELRHRLGGDLYVLAQCSAAGDQSPHVILNKAAEERMWHLAGRTERQEIGTRIADAITSILPAVEKDIQWEPVFAHRAETLHLSRRALTENDVREASAEADDLRKKYESCLTDLEAHPEKKLEPRWYVDVTYAYNRMQWCQGVASRFAIQKASPTLSTELHVVRLGDVAFATNPFEYYLDYGQRIKARSLSTQTFLVQLAGPGTYLPPERSISDTCYGTMAASTPIGPEGGQQIVEQTLNVIETLWRIP